MKAGRLWPCLRQQVELIELRGAVKDPADAPHHALVDHALADAEPVPVLQRALGKADRARALADPVGVVEQHDRLAALRQIDRKRQPDRSGADHHDRIARPCRRRSDPDRRGGDSRTGFWTAPCAQVALAKGLRSSLNSRNCNYLDYPDPPSTQIGAIFAKSVFKRRWRTGSRQRLPNSICSDLCRSG